MQRMLSSVLVFLVTISPINVLKGYGTEVQAAIARPDLVQVVFIPGIYGSGLVNPDTGQAHWGQNTYGERGLSTIDYPDLEPRKLDVDYVPARRLALQSPEVRVYPDIQAEIELFGANLNWFSYDWRLSNLYNAEILENYICSFIRESDQLVFIAHSMGGLVLSHWIRENFEPGESCVSGDTNRVSLFIFAGTPHRGSMEAVSALALGRNSFTNQIGFRLLFSENIVAEALSFPSVYELLPAANIITPACRRPGRDYGVEAVFDRGQGEQSLHLWSAGVWGQFELPALLPRDMSRDEAIQLIQRNLSETADSICNLNNHDYRQTTLSRMHFVTGYGEQVAANTVSRAILVSRGNRPHEMRVDMASGDATVPDWSAFPPWGLDVRQRDRVPRRHDRLLDDGEISLILREFLSEAAWDAGFRTASAVSPEQFASVLEELTTGQIDGLTTARFEARVFQLSELATASQISRNDVYDLARSYQGDNRDAYRAVGFAVAAIDSEDPMDPNRRFYANQNSAFALLRLGASELALTMGLRAGAELSEIEASSALTVEPYEILERKWGTVVASGVEQSNDLSSIFARGDADDGLLTGLEAAAALDRIEENPFTSAPAILERLQPNWSM